MTETIIARTTRSKSLPDRYEIHADAKLYRLGEQAPYFSVTAELHNLRYRGDNRIESCGCLHEDVLKSFPELAPVVRVHLADEHGVPMHAYENGRYWLGFTQWQSSQYSGPNGSDVTMPYFPHFASTWQISEEEARAAYDYCVAQAKAVLRGTDNHDELALRKARSDALYVLYVAMVPVWQAHADEALAVLQSEA